MQVSKSSRNVRQLIEHERQLIEHGRQLIEHGRYSSIVLIMYNGESSSEEVPRASFSTTLLHENRIDRRRSLVATRPTRRPRPFHEFDRALAGEQQRHFDSTFLLALGLPTAFGVCRTVSLSY